MKQKKRRSRQKAVATTTVVPITRRNPVANSRLMSKSGVHRKSGKAERQQARIRLGKAELERVATWMTPRQSFAIA